MKLIERILGSRRSETGGQLERKPTSRISLLCAARFEFRDGKIFRHRDTFDLWAWASQALGPMGRLMDWSSLVKNRIRAQAAAGLEAFLAKGSARGAT